MRRLALLLVAPLLFAPASASGQKLRDKISELFIFGPGQDPLFSELQSTYGNVADQAMRDAQAKSQAEDPATKLKKLGEMRDAGLITSRYGRIRVLKRRRLEHASCECYEVIRAHFERLGL